MATWRDVLGFDGEDLDFQMVHMRYRAKMMESPPADEHEYMRNLNWALEEARKELASQRVKAAT